MYIKHITLLLVCLACIRCAYAQNIVRAEYFIDKDPGYGKGKAININKSDTVIQFTDSLPVSNLKAGFHTLSIRTKNSSGSWWLSATKSFYVSADTLTNAGLPVNRAEYFIDKDPGSGKGKALSLKITDTAASFTDSIAAGNLVPGFHTLSIRTRNANGLWGLYKTTSFFVSADTLKKPVLPAIVRAEYFIDKDPGNGKGKNLKINKADTVVSFKDSISAATLVPGFHTLSIRTLNAEGRWSLFESRKFFVSADTGLNSLPFVTKAEYFIDKDPGTGKGKVLNINKSDTTVTFKDSIAVKNLSPGFHTLSIRTKNARGFWGLVATKSFYISSDTAGNDALPRITTAEYFLGEDPGEGKGKALKISKADTLVNFSDSVSINTSIPGFYTLSVRTKNAAGRWSLLNSMQFFIPYDTTDNDRDGLETWKEVTIYTTNPKNFDTNNDGLADGVNVFTGLQPKAADTDGDGISNIQEIANGTSPVLSDTDGDGVSDKLDPFPSDRFRSRLPLPNASDHTAPVISIEQPF